MHENEKEPKGVALDCEEFERSEDRPGHPRTQRWRVRDSGVGGERCSGLRSKQVGVQRARRAGVDRVPPGRATRACCVAGSWPWQQTRVAPGIGGGGRHPPGFTGRGQKSVRSCPGKPF